MAGIGLKKGILINFVAKYSTVLIQIIMTSILARLLTPKEFGIISLVMIFTTFFNLLGDMGIGPAIIQYKDLDDDDISSIFISTIFIAIVLSALFFAFSYLISYIYGNNVYISIGHLLCFSIIFNVLCIVPNGLQLKRKQFKVVGVSSLISNLVAGIITVFLAFKGFSYYALVFNSIIQACMNFLILSYFSEMKLNIRKFSLKPLKKISRFSFYQFSFNFVNYFSRNLDNLLIGKFLGMNALGYYDKAYKLMLYPVQNLTFVITPVLQPVLSDYQDRKDIILMHYTRIVKVLALIGVFISVVCFFSAREIVLIMFGQQWIGSIDTFKILSITIVIQTVLSSIGSIFQATGNTKRLFTTGVINSAIIILLIVVGLIFGKIEYIAFGLIIAFILNFLQAYYVLITKVFEQDYFEFLKEFRSTLIISLIMIIFYNIFNFKIDNLFISLVIKVLVGVVSYVLGLIVTREASFIKSIFK